MKKIDEERYIDIGTKAILKQFDKYDRLQVQVSSEEEAKDLSRAVIKSICSKFSPQPPAINWPEEMKHKDNCPLILGNLCDCKLPFYTKVCPSHGNYSCTCGTDEHNTCLSACKEAVKRAGDTRIRS